MADSLVVLPVIRLLLIDLLMLWCCTNTSGNTEDRISYIFTMYNIISTGETYDLDVYRMERPKDGDD